MKISIVGGGNAGCITALHYAFYTQDIDNLEIELIYNPDIPPEPVGQGTLLDVPKLLGLSVCGNKLKDTNGEKRSTNSNNST